MGERDALCGRARPIRFDASGNRASYLFISRGGAPIRLSASAYHLLAAVEAGLGFEELAAALSRQQGRTVSAAEVEASYRRLAGRLAEIDGRPRPATLPWGFWVRLRVLPAVVVNRLGRPLSRLLSPPAVPILLAAVVVAVVWLLGDGLPASLGGTAFWPGYALLVVSMLGHELGHASACVRFGVRPRDVGFAIYLIYPAFYSDVTCAWQLDRRQRVVVDLAGAYFQLLVGAGYTLGFLLTGWLPFRVASFMILYSCLFSLNPVFRFDGYWVLTDALGVTHLGRQPARMARRLLARLWRRAAEPRPWPAWVEAVLLVYTPLSFGVWAYFLWRLLPQLGERAAEYPALALTVIQELAAFSLPDGGSVQSFLASTFLFPVAILMAWRLTARLAATAGNLRSRGPESAAISCRPMPDS